ncbi:helix-turn-helix domain-containing protein [Paenibacillus sp. FSL H7-0737]|uniref:helix-turn-helix domain-containing protein n=1 Tax=unclassified Paenibacillus TaxID=185978 RepID=UPI0004F6C3CE|nr:helix-turn-helix domain-containing protein [Paenibacillus sp. FSL H7-0737]AIQ22005.1 excisionase family DNA binding domain-containing protein [Paenibacillus sp. FSL H7-0737]
MYDDYNEIITVGQLAELLQIGMNTAYKLINSGEIESFRVHNVHRIQRSAVTDYIIRKSTSCNRFKGES